MALDRFPDFSVAELLGLRRDASEALVSGQLTGWRSGDASSERIHNTNPSTVIEWVNASLYIRDPDAYPLTNAFRIRRTTPQYV